MLLSFLSQWIKSVIKKPLGDEANLQFYSQKSALYNIYFYLTQKCSSVFVKKFD